MQINEQWFHEEKHLLPEGQMKMQVFSAPNAIHGMLSQNMQTNEQWFHVNWMKGIWKRGFMAYLTENIWEYAFNPVRKRM